MNTNRDIEIYNALQDLKRIEPDPEKQKQLGRLFFKHFLLKSDVKKEIIRVIQLFKMWECESGEFNREEQYRLNQMLNEQFRELLDS